ncbi:hypothetical protein G3I24_29025 [Micromonospora aurantiaca]|nr:hypothetical protein [Micromonospora aurantiaca]
METGKAAAVRSRDVRDRGRRAGRGRAGATARRGAGRGRTGAAARRGAVRRARRVGARGGDLAACDRARPRGRTADPTRVAVGALTGGAVPARALTSGAVRARTAVLGPVLRAVADLTSAGLAISGGTARSRAISRLAARRLPACGLATRGFATRGLPAPGLAARGLTAWGLTAWGLTARDLAVSGLTARGLPARGLTACGLAARGLALGGLGARSVAALTAGALVPGALLRRPLTPGIALPGPLTGTATPGDRPTRGLRTRAAALTGRTAALTARSGGGADGWGNGWSVHGRGRRRGRGGREVVRLDRRRWCSGSGARAVALADHCGVVVGHPADHRRAHGGPRVEAAAADHHGEQALEQRLGERRQPFPRQDVVVDLREELAADHLYAADARADEGATGERHRQILVVEGLAVALDDLRDLGGGALPEFLQALLERLPGQPHQHVPQPLAEQADQRSDDLLTDLDQGGHRRRAEARGQRDGDLHDLCEGRDDDVVLGVLRVQREVVGRAAQRQRDVAAGRHVPGDPDLVLLERVHRRAGQAPGQPVAEVGGRAHPVEDGAAERVQLVAHGPQGGGVGLRVLLADGDEDQVVRPLPLRVVGNVEVGHGLAGRGWVAQAPGMIGVGVPSGA